MDTRTHNLWVLYGPVDVNIFKRDTHFTQLLSWVSQ